MSVSQAIEHHFSIVAKELVRTVGLSRSALHTKVYQHHYCGVLMTLILLVAEKGAEALEECVPEAEAVEKNGPEAKAVEECVPEVEAVEECVPEAEAVEEGGSEAIAGESEDSLVRYGLSCTACLSTLLVDLVLT